MPRVKREEEQQIDVKAPIKKETFATRWFNEYAVNNRTELKFVCDLTARSVYEQFTIQLKSNNTEVYGVIFYATFMTILKFLKGKQTSYNNFTIQIFNSVNIGYSNSTDENNEKVGNFMPIMEHIGINRSIVNDDRSKSETTKENCKEWQKTNSEKSINWQQLNSKKNVEYYKEIQEHAYDILKNQYQTNLRISEAIIPIFCIFMDNIVNVMKVKFKEADGTDVSEVSMNVFGLFDVYYSYNEEDDKEIIEFQPNITLKLALKSDDIAGRD